MGICTRAAAIMQIVGIVIVVFKIVVPIIIIILASVDLAKAVTSGDDKDIKEAAKKLLIRFLVGLIIFFLPSLIRVIFFTLTNSKTDDQYRSDASVCITCVTSPSQCNVSDNRNILK